MTAYSPCLEEIAVALPASLVEANDMRTVLPVKRYRELIEADAVTLLCISLGFLDLTDHAVVHNVRTSLVN